MSVFLCLPPLPRVMQPCLTFSTCACPLSSPAALKIFAVSETVPEGLCPVLATVRRFLSSPHNSPAHHMHICSLNMSIHYPYHISILHIRTHMNTQARTCTRKRAHANTHTHKPNRLLFVHTQENKQSNSRYVYTLTCKERDRTTYVYGPPKAEQK